MRSPPNSVAGGQRVISMCKGTNKRAINKINHSFICLSERKYIRAKLKATDKRAINKTNRHTYSIYLQPKNFPPQGSGSGEGSVGKGGMDIDGGKGSGGSGGTDINAGDGME